MSVLRRIAILFAVLLVASAALTAVAPRPDPADDERPTSSAPVTPAPTREGEDGAGNVTDAVRGTLPREKIVRARVGDNIELTVTARELDSATVDGFGLTDAASPGAPAQFSFRADRSGNFPVTLTLSGRRVGRIVVRDAKRSATKQR